ncbi:hypothetical protein RJP21_14955 [Paenibacillus sp. VCA1]|uniref:hypothetical protein n=1 Tax=Paenibacillus sp. VCA1 TaxID=3039148 RepID=UPI0028726901|nr:hypothetical protein [Paenibacillus sp. VCA1]MDR9854911.1 hypothetical protein [Paenibacillus sp. VCA1]
MKIIIMQQIQLDSSNRDLRNVYREFESNVIPHIGDFISDSAYKDPAEYEVAKVSINYYRDECYVSLYPVIIYSTNPADIDKVAKMMQSHGWTCPSLEHSV